MAGNTYPRDLLVVGAKPKAVAVVLANKNARITWAIIAAGDALREGEFATA
ncbi:hypothetical protein [Blastomonas sp.]|uniref:hypothetical protein n=1 Tax=Blastomonas sp. TaxID=1909299 RepID=UPI00261223E2|nr:hypothetical protein [Blastomonas sp.]MDM7955213.1 hypothetical protein [Blastomonas sp.]